MWGFLKFIIITAVLLIVFAVLLVGCLGYGIFGLVKELASEASTATMIAAQETESNAVVTADGITIYTQLEANHAIVLDGVFLCSGAGLSGYSSTIINGVARTVIGIDKTKRLPSDLTIVRKHGENCISQNIPNIKNYVRAVEYVTAVGYSQQQLVKWGIPTNIKAPVDSHSYSYSYGKLSDDKSPPINRTENTQFNTMSSLWANGVTKVTFHYSIKPTQDEFFLGTKRVKLQFGPKPLEEPKAAI